MSSFNPRSRKRPKEIQVPKLYFLGEQDGVPERELKNQLAEFFQRDQSVMVAYLARVAYGEQLPVSVALCLRTQSGPDRGLAEKVGKIFASMFGGHEHMDVIFLDDGQESALAKVCPPFFFQPA